MSGRRSGRRNVTAPPPQQSPEPTRRPIRSRAVRLLPVQPSRVRALPPEGGAASQKAWAARPVPDRRVMINNPTEPSGSRRPEREDRRAGPSSELSTQSPALAASHQARSPVPSVPGQGPEVPEQVPPGNLCPTPAPITQTLGPRTSSQCLAPDVSAGKDGVSKKTHTSLTMLFFFFKFNTH